jgi:hypothetical protein
VAFVQFVLHKKRNSKIKMKVYDIEQTRKRIVERENQTKIINNDDESMNNETP